MDKFLGYTRPVYCYGIAFWWWMRLTLKGWQGKPEQKELIDKVNASDQRRCRYEGGRTVDL